MMDISIDIWRLGLQWVVNFHFKVGDCLFDAIAYIIKY